MYIYILKEISYVIYIYIYVIIIPCIGYEIIAESTTTTKTSTEEGHRRG